MLSTDSKQMITTTQKELIISYEKLDVQGNVFDQITKTETEMNNYSNSLVVYM